MVNKVDDFPHSSARAHLNGKKDEILGEEIFDDGQRADYDMFIRSSVVQEEMQEIRYFTRTGRPLGSEEFISNIERKLQRMLTVQQPGRPKKV